MGPKVITMLMLETVMKMRTVCSTCSCVACCSLATAIWHVARAPWRHVCEGVELRYDTRTAEHRLSAECGQAL